MNIQAKRIFVSTMLVIDIIIVLYLCTLGNWGIGVDNEYLVNTDDLIFLIPLMLVIMWIKLFSDLLIFYYLSRSFQESIGLLEKSMADTNWFLSPAYKVCLFSTVIQFLIAILDAFDHEAFDDGMKIEFGDFLGSNILRITTAIEVIVLLLTFGLFLFTKHRD